MHNFIMEISCLILKKFANEGYKADVLVVDPPRRGMELQVLNYLQKSKIKKIIYVSCNPATLAKKYKSFTKKL